MDCHMGNAFFTGNLRDFLIFKIDPAHQLPLGRGKGLHGPEQAGHIFSLQNLLLRIFRGEERLAFVFHPIEGNMAAGFLVVVVIFLPVKIHQQLPKVVVHLDFRYFSIYKFIPDFQFAVLLSEPGKRHLCR